MTMSPHIHCVSVATPEDPRGEFFLQILDGEELLEKCRWNIFKRQEEGLKIFGQVSDRFSDLFHVFQTMFRIEIEKHLGQFRSADVLS